MTEKEGPLESTRSRTPRGERRMLPSVSEVVKALASRTTAEPGLVFKVSRQVCAEELDRIRRGLPSATLDSLVERAESLLDPKTVMRIPGAPPQAAGVASTSPFAPAAPEPLDFPGLPSGEVRLPAKPTSVRSSEDPFEETTGALDLKWGADPREPFSEPETPASSDSPTTVLFVEGEAAKEEARPSRSLDPFVDSASSFHATRMASQTPPPMPETERFSFGGPQDLTEQLPRGASVPPPIPPHVAAEALDPFAEPPKLGAYPEPAPLSPPPLPSPEPTDVTRPWYGGALPIEAGGAFPLEPSTAFEPGVGAPAGVPGPREDGGRTWASDEPPSEDTGDGASPDDREPPAEAPDFVSTRHASRRRPLILGLVVAAVLLGGGFGAYVYLTKGSGGSGEGETAPKSVPRARRPVGGVPPSTPAGGTQATKSNAPEALPPGSLASASAPTASAPPVATASPIPTPIPQVPTTTPEPLKPEPTAIAIAAKPARPRERTAAPAATAPEPRLVEAAPPAAHGSEAQPSAGPPIAGVKQTRAGTTSTVTWNGKEPVFAVHFTSYKEVKFAERDAAQLSKRLGKPGFAVEVDLGEKGTWYRVFVGDFKLADEAFAFRRELEEKKTPNLGLVYRVVGKS